MSENQPNTFEERMRGLRGRLERLREAPAAHLGIDGMLRELSAFEALPGTDTPEARAEWADKDHIRGQLAEIEEAVAWEENREGIGGGGV